ncbi:hypothetical protein MHU86_4933 [Fragilaria crotonensis]|nr:hypothetical protein MHU86_4933 [Fragilaria crotonensis]
MRSFTTTFTWFALCLAIANAFSPTPVSGHASKTALQMQESRNNDVAKVIATAFLAASIATAAPAFAATDFAGSTELILAGRSGGRAGGRSGGGGYSRSRGPSRAPPTAYRSSTTIIRPMIASPPVVISPFGGGFGYGYNPFGGVGLGYGLGAMNSYGNEMRDYRQEAEIQKEKAELELAKEKNAELEARIKALEQTGQPLQVQQ